MEIFILRIYAAEKVFYEGECKSLIIPAVNGQFGVLAHHSNMIAAIVPGILSYKNKEGEEVVASVSSGLIKVEDNDVLVLVDSIERPEEIDVNRAKKAAAKAKEELLQKRTVQEYKQAQANLARAISRLKLKSFQKKR